MGLYLNREALRVVGRNERGVVNYRKRYKRGDKVDTSKMPDTQVENLKNSGALVSSQEDVADGGAAPVAQPSSPPFGAATAASTPGEETEADTPEAQTEPVQSSAQDGGDAEESFNPDDGTSPNTEGGADTEDVDEYSEMDYQQLQEASKTANLQYVGVSADTMRDNLRANKSS